MENIYSKKCQRVFEIFSEIASVPRGSGNREGIAKYCADFAEKLNLKYIVDNAHNVIIYKPASKGYENFEPVILQGHLDMVCQKTNDREIDFLKDGITLVKDGDWLKADRTTLGADNGIAVAMTLSILERNDIKHPAIEAVFTADEEIGMLGAADLDTSVLKGKKFINIDSESDDVVTVSCAGGIDFKAFLKTERTYVNETLINISINGLKGGHSGGEIDKNRVNADTLLGRLLNHLSLNCEFNIVSVNGGDKGNAIPKASFAAITGKDPQKIEKAANEYLTAVKGEIAQNEESFCFDIKTAEKKQYSVLNAKNKKDIIFALCCTPNGIIAMSPSIKGLVETSLNLGILKTEESGITLGFALRSSKQTALDALTEKLSEFFSMTDFYCSTSGFYPPWELKENSPLADCYVKTAKGILGFEPKVEAIHAGLECAIFSASIKDSDCISVGPTMFDVHTTDERLSISSTEKVYSIVLKLLENLNY